MVLCFWRAWWYSPMYVYYIWASNEWWAKERWASIATKALMCEIMQRVFCVYSANATSLSVTIITLLVLCLSSFSLSTLLHLSNPDTLTCLQILKTLCSIQISYGIARFAVQSVLNCMHQCRLWYVVCSCSGTQATTNSRRQRSLMTHVK